MVNLDWHGIFSGLLNVVLLLAGLFYATLVLLSYLEGRGRVRPEFSRSNLGRSLERLAVWLGVKTLALAVRMGTPIFDMLSEASAEVGEWVLNRRPHHRI
jgi:hypothetical protein